MYSRILSLPHCDSNFRPNSKCGCWFPFPPFGAGMAIFHQRNGRLPCFFGFESESIIEGQTLSEGCGIIEGRYITKLQPWYKTAVTLKLYWFSEQIPSRISRWMTRRELGCASSELKVYTSCWHWLQKLWHCYSIVRSPWNYFQNLFRKWQGVRQLLPFPVHIAKMFLAKTIASYLTAKLLQSVALFRTKEIVWIR